MKKKITVYSCSGCSNVAQLANAVAVRLHRQGLATMSCIAGVGGDVASLVKTAERADTILVLDGCPLSCAKQCLNRHSITPDVHLILTDDGLTKNTAEDFSEEMLSKTFDKVLCIIDELNKKDK